MDLESLGAEQSGSRLTSFRALNQIVDTLRTATTPEQVLTALVSGARGLLPFTAAALALRQGGSWSVWRASARRPDLVNVNASIPEAAEETLAHFLSYGEALYVDDLLAPPWNGATHRDILWKDGTRSALLIPLHAWDAPLGALAFTSTVPEQYTQESREVARLVAWLAAVALQGVQRQDQQGREEAEARK